MEQISTAVRKANKDHRCDWCREVIHKGEKYEISCHKNGGDIYSWKNHLKCLMLYRHFDMEGVDGVGSDTFMQYIYDYLRDKAADDEEFDEWTEGDCIDRVVEMLREEGAIDVKL